MIRVLIVDDEPPARRKLAGFINTASPRSHIIEAADGSEARQILQSQPVDLLFLDIHMPKLSGLELVEKIGTSKLPPVVFVTAYDEYAIQAFELEAVDYLLKPYDQPRFMKAFDRVIKKIQTTAPNIQSLERLIGTIGTASRSIDRFMVKVGNRLLVVQATEVSYIAAEDKYTRIFVHEKSFLLSRTLRDLENCLDQRKFARIHRSHIVNVDYLKELVPWSHGDYQLILKDGTELLLSRRYRQRFMDKFGF